MAGGVVGVEVQMASRVGWLSENAEGKVVALPSHWDIQERERLTILYFCCELCVWFYGVPSG